MAAKPKPKGNGKNILTKKLGPLPVWVWVATAVGTYLAYRYFTGANASAAQVTTPSSTDSSGTTGTPTDTSGLTGGSVTGSTPDTSGYTAYSDILSQLEGQNASLTSALLAGESNYTASGLSSGGGGGSSSGSGAPASTVASKSPYISGGTQSTIPTSTPNFAQAAVAKTAAGAATGTKLAFGGVTSVKTLKNGATLTTYASGRKVEQAKGKSAYVVHQ